MQNKNTVDVESNTEDEGVDFQDLALAFLTKGMLGLRNLYLHYAIPPAMSMEVWGYLHSKNATTEELALWLINIHIPLTVQAQA